MVLCVTVKLVPPPRPTATKLSDSSVMLEWAEYQLHGNDLEVSFVKIQYREISSSTSHSRTWNTMDDDLDPTTRSYVISTLKPGSRCADSETDIAFSRVCVSVSACLSVYACPCLCLSVSLCVSVCLSMCPFLSVCLCAPVCLSLCLSFYVLVSQVSVCLSVCLSVCPCLSVSLSLFLSVCMCRSVCTKTE